MPIAFTPLPGLPFLVVACFASVALAKSAQPPAMTCTPAVLHTGDTLHITLPFPHGRYLEVKPPAGANMSIAFAFDDKQRAIIPETVFLAMKAVDLKVSEAAAFNWTNMRREKLFVTPGRYEFGVGNDFETDEPSVDGECAVTFEP